MDQLGLLIANEDQEATGGAVFERLNPISRSRPAPPPLR